MLHVILCAFGEPGRASLAVQWDGVRPCFKNRARVRIFVARRPSPLDISAAHYSAPRTDPIQ